MIIPEYRVWGLRGAEYMGEFTVDSTETFRLFSHDEQGHSLRLFIPRNYGYTYMYRLLWRAVCCAAEELQSDRDLLLVRISFYPQRKEACRAFFGAWHSSIRSRGSPKTCQRVCRRCPTLSLSLSLSRKSKSCDVSEQIRMSEKKWKEEIKVLDMCRGSSWFGQ